MFLLCLDCNFVADRLMCTSVVERRRFDADPDRLSVLMIRPDPYPTPSFTHISWQEYSF